jgi:predicted RNA-binding protein YlxR (DUF448 family)
MKPIRMCLNCRTRSEKKQLVRLQCVNSELVSFTNHGRSFYICKNCINRDTTIKKIFKLCGKKIAKDEFLKTIEEILN